MFTVRPCIYIIFGRVFWVPLTVSHVSSGSEKTLYRPTTVHTLLLLFLTVSHFLPPHPMQIFSSVHYVPLFRFSTNPPSVIPNVSCWLVSESPTEHARLATSRHSCSTACLGSHRAHGLTQSQPCLVATKKSVSMLQHHSCASAAGDAGLLCTIVSDLWTCLPLESRTACYANPLIH